MTISMSHKDLQKLRQERARKVNSSRRNRAALLTDKTMKKALKKFDKEHDPNQNVSGELSIDEHVKMNDSYMRTGWYVPKKK